MKEPKCGMSVEPKLGKVCGIITAELKRFRDRQYEISYIKDGERVEMWLHKEEFDIRDGSKKIGY